MKLAQTLSRLGRGDEAEQAFETSVALKPFQAELVEAAEHQRAGRLPEAEQIYRGVLVKDPDNVNAMRMLAAIATQMQQHADASALLRRAVTLAPDFFAAWNDLGHALMERDQLDEAIEAVGRAIRLQPEVPYSYLMLGNVRARAGDYESAIAAYQQAIDRHPENAGALAGLGHVLKTIGRQEESIEIYRRAITAHPAYGEAYWSLANLKTFRFEDAEVAAMEQQLKGAELGEETRVNFLFALAKAYEDRGDYDLAFETYEKGNAVRRMKENYDPVQTEVVHDRIIDVIDRELLTAKSGLGEPDPAPIFIIGLPRSGSTLIEQILASHSKIDGTQELPDITRIIRTINKRLPGKRTYPEGLLHLPDESFRELGQQYLRSTQRARRGKPYFTDKMPNNFPSVGLIHLMLPNAKFIDARRHPLDSCFGGYKQLFFKGQPFTYDLVELGEYYLEYRRMMAHWHQLLPGKILEVHYEDMVTDQEAQTRRLLEHCGVAWEPGCLAFHETERAVNTASSEQVRQPIYANSVQSWRHFEAHLGPLIEVLEPVLETLPPEQRPASMRSSV